MFGVRFGIIMHLDILWERRIWVLIRGWSDSIAYT